MFRLFSRTRQKLLSDGRTLRYLGYAIGEILLVVIGILIALQINNWAEDRTDRSFERKTLLQIHRNLKQDNVKLTGIVANREKAILAIDAITTIEDPGNPPGELGQWFADVMNFDRFHSITNAYEVLKSRGLDLIQDDELRFALGIYYDGLASEIPQHNKDLETAFNDTWVPMIINDFDDFEWMVRAQPSDPVRLLRDRRLSNTLRLERSNHAGAAWHVQRMIDANLQLQALIEASVSD